MTMRIARCNASIWMTAGFVVLLFAWLSYFISQYPPDLVAIPGYGSAEIPKSDGHRWSLVALRFFFDLPAEATAPRLFPGLMFASLFAVNGSLSTIAVLPGFLLLFVLSYSFFIGTPRERVLMIGFIGAFIALHQTLLAPLPWGSIMVDPLAFSLSLAAVLLLWQGCKYETSPHWVTLTVALLCLGSVAAIRGLPILAGLLWIGCIGFWFRTQLTGKKWLLLLLAFLLPTFGEALLHTHYGITSNLATALWAFTVPPYRWTVEGNDVLMKLLLVDKSLTHADIYTQYLQFIFSTHGITTFFTLLTERIHQDFTAATHPAFLLLCIALQGATQLLALLRSEVATRPWTLTSLLAGITLLLLLATKINALGSLLSSLLLAWLLTVLITSLYCRMKLVSLLLCLYLGSLVIFIVLGSSGEERTAATYHFALYLAIVTLMLLTEKPDHHTEKPPLATLPLSLPMITALHTLLLFFLYFGSHLLPNPLKTQFQQAQRQHGNIAIKISQNQAIDRALYFNQAGQLFLTQVDNVPIGRIVAFRQLTTHPAPDFMMKPGYANNDRFYTASIFNPFAFVEGKIVE